MNNNVKEVSRRSAYHSVEWQYGVSYTMIEAEIVVEDEGKTVYLFSPWFDADGDVVYHAFTKSVFDIEVKLSESKEYNDALHEECKRLYVEAEIDFEKYREPFAKELWNMIDAELKAHGGRGLRIEDEEE